MTRNYRCLSLEELSRLAICDETAKQYVADNADVILGNLDETIDIRERHAYQDGYVEGLDRGGMECRDELYDMFSGEIERVLMSMDTPEKLGKKKLRIHTLLSNILAEIER